MKTYGESFLLSFSCYPKIKNLNATAVAEKPTVFRETQCEMGPWTVLGAQDLLVRGVKGFFPKTKINTVKETEQIQNIVEFH